MPTQSVEDGIPTRTMGTREKTTPPHVSRVNIRGVPKAVKLAMISGVWPNATIPNSEHE
jgi:hypothetical protein